MLHGRATDLVAHNPDHSIHGGGLMNRKYLAAFVAAFSLIAFHAVTASAASAALHPFIPEGLSHHKATAYGQVMSRASVDSGVGHFMAQETGESTFVASHYVAWGYRNGAPGTVNAGVDGYGNFVRTADTGHCNVHSLMFVIKNKKTGQTVMFCVACGNGRPHTTRPVPYHTFTKNTVVRINKTFKKKFTYVCLPSGQSVTAVVTTWVHGTFHYSTWVKAQGDIKVKTTNGYKISINQTVKFTCGGIPAMPLNLNKLWQDASGKDITASQLGRAVSVLVAVYDNKNGQWVQHGNSYHTTIKTGTITVLALPSVQAGQAVQSCEQDFDADNWQLIDPNSGSVLTKPCLFAVVKAPTKPMNHTFINRQKSQPKCTSNCGPTPPPTCTSNCSPPPPPTCTNNCTPTVPKDTPDLPPPSPTPNDPNPTGGATDPQGHGSGDTTGNTPSGPVNPDGGQSDGNEAPDPQ